MDKQIIKIRRCMDKRACQFKNVWWDATQCLAKFHIYHTCLHKGAEQKIKKVIKDE